MDNEKTVDEMIADLCKNIDKKQKKSKNRKSKVKKKYKYNYYWNKYVEELGLKYDDIDITNWTLGKNAKKIKKKTGVDYRECYNFDMSVALYIYSRLKAYKKYTIADLEYEEKYYGNYRGTLKSAIDIVLNGLKLYVKDEAHDKKYLDKCQKYLGLEEVPEHFNMLAPSMVFYKAMNMFAEIGPAIWD